MGFLSRARSHLSCQYSEMVTVILFLTVCGIEIFDDLESASQQMVQVKERVEPDPANVKVYAEVFDLYVKIYEGLADVFPKQEE